ncbi:vitamin B12 dependent-methionine synthase activation domain-containing protein [Chloroflexota bacterium]
MVTATNLIDARDVRIDKKRVYRRIGYSPGNRVSARISNLIDDYIDNVDHIIEPAYSYVIRDVEWVQESRVFIDGSITLESKVIAQLLEQCNKVAMFIMTIGSHLEETTRQLADDGLVLQSAILDAVGSNATEKVAGCIQNEIEEIVREQGFSISPRFSPGYCDWDIRQQQMIFQVVDGDPLGIHLTETCLMIPRKSISGIIGIGTPDSNVSSYNPCRTCHKRNCTSRRTRFTT